jgi:hypothetical protein
MALKIDGSIMSKPRKPKQNQNQKQLGDIANIRAGYTFRESVKEVDDGNAHIVQIKDARKALELSGGHQLLPEYLPEINWKGNQKIFADAECVILPVRGEYTRAAYINNQELDINPIVVSSQFLILTPKDNSLDAEYLCWALNQPSAQSYFKQESRGTRMSMLSMASVSDLKLPLPSVYLQEKIIHLHRLWEREQKLIKNLLQNREQLLKATFDQLLHSQPLSSR